MPLRRDVNAWDDTKCDQMTYCRVSNERVCNIRKHPPNISHSSAKLLGTASAHYNIALACIKAAYKRADTRACDVVDGNTTLLEGTQDTLLSYQRMMTSA